MPGNAGEFKSAALGAYQSGEIALALELGSQWHQADPNDHEAVIFIGIVLSRQGKHEEAIPLLNQAAARSPCSFEAHYWLATALRRSGRSAEAVAPARNAVNVHPRDPQAKQLLGLCLLEVQDWPAAAIQLEQAAKLAPEVASTHFSLGCVYEEIGRLDEASRCFRRTITLNPAHVQALCRLGQSLIQDLDYPSALDLAERALAVEPDSPAGHTLMAGALAGLNRAEGAHRHALRVVELEPSKAGSLVLLGSTLQSLGEMEEAEASFSCAITMDSRESYAYYGLVRAHKVQEDDRPLVEKMEDVLSDPSLPRQRHRDLEYALGKAYSDLCEYQESMRHYDEANGLTHELRFGDQGFDRKLCTAETDFAIRVFGKEFVKERGDAPPGPVPIFIVGMMRSGTTLVEQILSCHPSVGAGGEQRFWMDKRSKVMDAPGDRVNRQRLQKAAEAHIRLLAEAAPGKECVVNKMPGNYLHLGLMFAALPHAPIIHVRRRPIDTCLSIWMTYNSTAVAFANVKSDLVFAYREYQRLMAHWREVLPPEAMLEIDYEDLVSDPEPITRQMVAFSGLEWDDRCLRPEDNTRVVTTPSNWQVRQPIYKSAVNRWRPYEPWLGELAELLDEPSV